MIVSKLIINSFKSIHNAVIPLDPKISVLIGPNESGKTNILKAIEYFKPECALTTEQTCQFSNFYVEDKPPHISLELCNFTRDEQNKLGKIYDGFKTTDSLLLRREGPGSNDYKIQNDSKILSIGDIRRSRYPHRT